MWYPCKVETINLDLPDLMLNLSVTPISYSGFNSMPQTGNRLIIELNNILLESNTYKKIALDLEFYGEKFKGEIVMESIRKTIVANENFVMIDLPVNPESIYNINTITILVKDINERLMSSPTISDIIREAYSKIDLDDKSYSIKSNKIKDRLAIDL